MPMTICSPVARAIRCSARGSRPIPRHVGSTTVSPPASRNRRTSSVAVTSSKSSQLSRHMKGSWRSSPSTSIDTGW